MSAGSSRAQFGSVIPRAGEQTIPTAANLTKAAILLGLTGLSFYTADAAVRALPTGASGWPWPWWSFAAGLGIVFGFAVLNCTLLTGVGVVAHEAVHGVLCRNKYLNDFLGGVFSSLLVFLPFYANRKFHLDHHRHTHTGHADPEEELHKHGFWAAFFLGGPIAMLVHYRILFSFLFDRGPKRARRRLEALLDLAYVASAALFYFVALPALGISIWYTALPTFLTGAAVYSFRALCDHYGVPDLTQSTPWVKALCPQLDRAGRFQVVDSWVVLTNPLMNWMWSHINYQQVHHRYPYLSHVYLPSVYEATKEHQPYLVVSGYVRCLASIRGLPYYAAVDDVKPFLQLPDKPVELDVDPHAEIGPTASL